MFLVHLIGPSGVGKSTLGKRASKRLVSVSYVDLDEMMQARNRALFRHDGTKWCEFWGLANECFRELEGHDSKGVCLVDCGAGCLKTEHALSYFKRSQSLVLVYDSPENAFKRAKARPGGYWSSGSLDQYAAEEYSQERKRFYDAAKYTVDIRNLTEEESVEKFVSLVSRIAASCG